MAYANRASPRGARKSRSTRPSARADCSASEVRNGPPTAVMTVVMKAELATSYSVKPETARRRTGSGAGAAPGGAGLAVTGSP